MILLFDSKAAQIVMNCYYEMNTVELKEKSNVFLRRSILGIESVLYKNHEIRPIPGGLVSRKTPELITSVPRVRALQTRLTISQQLLVKVKVE